jgi:hypothetical protein
MGRVNCMQQLHRGPTVRSASDPAMVGASAKRCNGTMGNSCPMAHASGSERKTLMLAWYHAAGCLDALCTFP